MVVAAWQVQQMIASLHELSSTRASVSHLIWLLHNEMQYMFSQKQFPYIKFFAHANQPTWAQYQVTLLRCSLHV